MGIRVSRALQGAGSFGEECLEPTVNLVFIKVGGQGVFSETLCQIHTNQIEAARPREYREMRRYDRPGPKTCECDNPDEFARGHY